MVKWVWRKELYMGWGAEGGGGEDVFPLAVFVAAKVVSSKGRHLNSFL